MRGESVHEAVHELMRDRMPNSMMLPAGVNYKIITIELTNRG